MSFPEKLKTLRESHNHTQQNLADLLGVRKSSISNYETGRSYPKRIVLLKLAKIYNVPPASLLENNDISKLATDDAFDIETPKKIYVYKSPVDCLLTDNAPAAYCISIPAALIGTGEYKAFIDDSGNVVVVDSSSSPQPGDTVFALSQSGKVIYGKYCVNSSPAIVSKTVDGKDETSVFDVEKDEIEILAVAIKIFADLN